MGVFVAKSVEEPPLMSSIIEILVFLQINVRPRSNCKNKTIAKKNAPGNLNHDLHLFVGADKKREIVRARQQNKILEQNSCLPREGRERLPRAGGGERLARTYNNYFVSVEEEYFFCWPFP
jgi:hypothetical protein